MSYFLMCLIIVSIILPYVQRFWAVYLIWSLYKFLFYFYYVFKRYGSVTLL